MTAGGASAAPMIRAPDLIRGTRIGPNGALPRHQ